MAFGMVGHAGLTALKSRMLLSRGVQVGVTPYSIVARVRRVQMKINNMTLLTNTQETPNW